MRRFALLVVVVLTLVIGSVAQGASYQKTNGNVWPIRDWQGGMPHSYSGDNLEPFAYLENANLTGAGLENANLTEANLTYANLSNASLPYANLNNANLDNANLDNANLESANLTNANLYAAYLPYAYLTGAYLPYADLTGADLTYANLELANLNNANLYYANLEYANLDGATFSTGTTLYDGQTVLQHGFDAAGLQAYLQSSPVNASYANIILVPEPHTLLLASLASLGLTLRRRRSAR
jgi:hypothetical protein